MPKWAFLACFWVSKMFGCQIFKNFLAATGENSARATSRLSLEIGLADLEPGAVLPPPPGYGHY